ncbi:MAG: nitroreductase [FCB group bacterium]|nr:nitroreductase [FCB group bacterium]
MNEILKTIHQRKSIRAYVPEPIPAELKEKIIAAALRSPTAGNLMLYSILEVTDPAKKDKLSRTCDNQPFIARAPWVLLFLADYQRWYDFYKAAGIGSEPSKTGETLRKPDVGDLFLACCDALIAAQTSVLAAESLGIGSCYIGDIMENYETHKKMFDLPPYVFPISLICYGYPTAQQNQRQRSSRFTKELILHRDTYRKLNRERAEMMTSELKSRFEGQLRKEKYISNMGQLMYNRKFNSDFMKEMNRSVKVIIKNWGESE